MAKENFEKSLKIILHHEGGFVNHPKDPGGMTNLGVTRATYESYLGRKVTEQEMRQLTPEKVRPLYKTQYWDRMRCDELPTGLDLCIFDFGVNAGTNRAIRYLQLMLKVKIDGIIGPKTIAAANEFARKTNDNGIVKYQDLRREYYRKLKTFSTFGRGWLRRVNEVEIEALGWV